jgi:hypothetical protein
MGDAIAAVLSNYHTRKDEINYNITNNLPTYITLFNSNLGDYIKSGGFDQVVGSTGQQSNVASPSYLVASSNWSQIQTVLSNTQQLTKDMTASLASYNGTNSDETNDVARINTVKDNILTAQSNLTQSQIDLDISTSRQDSITTSTKDHSYVQGLSGNLGFTRPIKPTSVALLIGIGFFILFVTGLILKDFFMLSADIAAEYFSLSEISSYLSASTSRSIILGIVGTFVLYAIGLYVYFYVYLK